MVKLTENVIERKHLQLQSKKSLSKIIKKDNLWKLTHLHMNDMFINEIGNFAACKNLKVIYLQNNNISKIENLNFATNLTHLYLQHNNINKIENLNLLWNLQKLYLGHNNILVVEGLENLENLIELHIESQKLEFGESLCFDPRSINTLSKCMKRLNVSNNKLTTLKGIDKCYALEILEAEDNLIENIHELTQTISTLTYLKELYLIGNSICKQHRYRENLIASSDTLVHLDGKAISEISRHFMKNFKEKCLQQKKKNVKITLSEDITTSSSCFYNTLALIDSLNLPPAFKKSISRATFQNAGPKLSITVTSVTGEFQSQFFPCWKSALATKSVKDNHIIPRPFWKGIGKSNDSSHIICSLTNDESAILPPI